MYIRIEVIYVERSLAVLCIEIVELSQISPGLMTGWYEDSAGDLKARNDPNVAARVQWGDLPREWWSYDVSKMLIMLGIIDKEPIKAINWTAYTVLQAIRVLRYYPYVQI